MNLEFRLNSKKYALAGVVVIISSILAAIFFSAWFWLVALVGVPLIWRLERTRGEKLLVTLQQAVPQLVLMPKAFRARIGDYFLHGPLDDTITQRLIDLARLQDEQENSFSLSEEAMAANQGRVRLHQDSTQVDEVIRALRNRSVVVRNIDDYIQLSYLSNNSLLTISTSDTNVELPQLNEAERDKVVDMLAPITLLWDTKTQEKTVFQFNFVLVLLYTISIAFCSAVALTGMGVVGPKDLPLINAQQAQRVRGKGAVFAWIMVGLSNLYLWLVANLPPVMLGVLGCVLLLASLIGLLYSFWAHPTQTTMRRI